MRIEKFTLIPKRIKAHDTPFGKLVEKIKKAEETTPSANLVLLQRNRYLVNLLAAMGFFISSYWLL